MPERAAEDGKDEDHAFGHRAVIGGDVKDEEHIDRQHQRVRAEGGAEAAAAAAAETRPAEDGRGKDLQKDGRADQRIARTCLRCDEKAAGRVKGTGDDIGREFDSDDADAAGACSFFVAADGINAGAEPRILDDGPDCERNRDDDHRGR